MLKSHEKPQVYYLSPMVKLQGDICRRNLLGVWCGRTTFVCAKVLHWARRLPAFYVSSSEFYSFVSSIDFFFQDVYCIFFQVCLSGLKDPWPLHGTIVTESRVHLSRDIGRRKSCSLQSGNPIISEGKLEHVIPLYPDMNPTCLSLLLSLSSHYVSFFLVESLAKIGKVY